MTKEKKSVQQPKRALTQQDADALDRQIASDLAHRLRPFHEAIMELAFHVEEDPKDE